MTPDQLLHQLESIVGLRNHEHQTWLNFFFASFSTTSLLFVALFSGEAPEYWEVITIAAFGIFLTIRFHTLQDRAFQTMRAYEEMSKVIEGRIKLQVHDFFGYNTFRGNFTADKDSKMTPEQYCAEQPKRERNKGKARNSINEFYLATILIWALLVLIYSVLEFF